MRFTGLVIVAAALATTGCATRDYVDTQVGDLSTRTDGRFSAFDGRLNSQDARMGQIQTLAQQALDRANAAGKLAEGKFLYDVTLTDDQTLFSTGSADLTAEAQGRLTQIADQLRAENRSVYLEIQGHTDSVGDAEANMRLGKDRAEAVRRFLNSRGIPLHRMSTISYGATQPVADNTSRAGRAANRRVAILVMA